MTMEAPPFGGSLPVLASWKPPADPLLAFDEYALLEAMMNVSIDLPLPMRRFAQGGKRIQVTGRSTVRETLEEVIIAFPRLGKKLLSEDQKVYGFISVFINNVDARSLGGEHAPIRDGDTITLIAALAGG
jgi:molybdopterin converting factor small subunit